MDLNDDVYARLTPEARRRVLASVGIQAAPAPDHLGLLETTSTKRADLNACLETLAVLSDESAATLVKAMLSDQGVVVEAFGNYASALDRAADLWTRDQEQAKQALRWWQANVEVRKQTFVAAYAIPAEGMRTDPNAEEEARLKSLISAALRESLQPSDIRSFRVSKRPSPWPGCESEQVIQIDIKRSTDPERVEIDEEGVILVKSLKFIVPILIVIDPTRRAMYVMSRTNPRKLRQSIAMAVLQVYFGRGSEPEKLPKLYVHPGKLARRPRFRFPKGTRIVAADVVSMIYRNLDEPGVRRSVTAEKHGIDLYGLADLARTDALHAVHEASIRFALNDRRDGSKMRTCSLMQPNNMSFPHFAASDQAAVEEFLVLNDLVDPNPFIGQIGPFDILAGLIGDIHSSRLQEAVGEEWMQALTSIGALANGPAADSAHCGPCDAFYPVQPDRTSGLNVLACPDHARAIAPADVETSRFLPDRLAAWLAAGWGTDVHRPSEVLPGVWDLGSILGRGRVAAIPLMLSTTRLPSETLVGLSQRIAARASAPPGLVLSLSSALLEMKLPLGWKVTSLAGLLDVRDGAMHVLPDGPRALLSGKKPRKKSPDRWPELLAAYQTIRQPGLGHYEAADRLLDLQEWPWKRDHIARRLKKELPGDFG